MRRFLFRKPDGSSYFGIIACESVKIKKGEPNRVWFQSGDYHALFSFDDFSFWEVFDDGQEVNILELESHVEIVTGEVL